MRRSEMLASSATAMARKSLTKPIGSAWKLPPERMSSPKMSGLSETPLQRGRQHLARVVERVLDRAEHLRHAAHGVRILHAVAVLVAALDLAVREQAAERARHSTWPGRRRAGVDARVEGTCSCRRGRRPSAAPTTIDASSSRSALQQALDRERGGELRAVQQREPFLRLELERFEPGRARHGGP